MSINGRVRKLTGLLIIIALVGNVSSCTTATSSDHDRTLDDFSFLKPEMSYEDIVAQVGKPDRDVGSGVYLFQYDLIDGTHVMLQFITLDKLTGAWLVKSDGAREDLLDQP